MVRLNAKGTKGTVTSIYFTVYFFYLPYNVNTGQISWVPLWSLCISKQINSGRHSHLSDRESDTARIQRGAAILDQSPAELWGAHIPLPVPGTAPMYCSSLPWHLLKDLGGEECDIYWRHPNTQSTQDTVLVKTTTLECQLPINFNYKARKTNFLWKGFKLVTCNRALPLTQQQCCNVV